MKRARYSCGREINWRPSLRLTSIQPARLKLISVSSVTCRFPAAVAKGRWSRMILDLSHPRFRQVVRHFLANTGEIFEDLKRPLKGILDVQLDIFPADVLNKFSLF